MKKLVFETTINAPVAKVYDFMLGLSNKNSYEKWTAAFNPTSSFEGEWKKGAKMYFLGENEEGEKGGMVSQIEELIPNHYVSILHLGFLKGAQEITSGPEVEAWAGAHENYRFEESNGNCVLKVELDTVADFEDYMNDSYPKGLALLKELCEA